MLGRILSLRNCTLHLTDPLTFSMYHMFSDVFITMMNQQRTVTSLTDRMHSLWYIKQNNSMFNHFIVKMCCYMMKHDRVMLVSSNDTCKFSSLIQEKINKAALLNCGFTHLCTGHHLCFDAESHTPDHLAVLLCSVKQQLTSCWLAC